MISIASFAHFEFGNGVMPDLNSVSDAATDHQMVSPQSVTPVHDKHAD